MLPDGAETQLDDWTIFFLNQTPFNTISPILALDTPEVKSVGLPGEEHDASDRPELLCVLNLVRTKHDKSLDRYDYSNYSFPYNKCSSLPLEGLKSLLLLFVRDTHSSRYLRCADISYRTVQIYIIHVNDSHFYFSL